MKPNTFVVTFRTGKKEIVSVIGGYAEARILAQARQIEKGNKYEVKSINWINPDKD